MLLQEKIKKEFYGRNGWCRSIAQCAVQTTCKNKLEPDASIVYQVEISKKDAAVIRVQTSNKTQWNQW